MLSKTTWFKEKGNLHEADVDEEKANADERSSSHQGGNEWGSDFKAPKSGSDDDAPSTSQRGSNFQGEMKRNGKKKKRGADREYITLGGLKRIEVANKRKARQKLNRKLGKMDLPAGREKVKLKKKGPPPQLSVFALLTTLQVVCCLRG